MNPWTHIILSGFIVAGAGIWHAYSWIQLQNQDKVLTGKLSGKILDENKPYILNFGNNFRIFKGSILRKGVNLAELSAIHIEGVNIPIKIYDENNRLLIDATVYDKDDNVVCQIVRNDWEVNPKGSYQRNYSVNAFEIVDSNLQPVLQIYLEENNKLYFGGYFYTKSGNKMYYSMKGITDIEHDMPTLFKYPASKYLGQLQKRGK